MYVSTDFLGGRGREEAAWQLPGDPKIDGSMTSGGFSTHEAIKCEPSYAKKQ